MKVVFIVPCFNASKNIENLVSSVNSQQNENWEMVIVDDMSEDNTFEKSSELSSEKITVLKNSEKKFALRNIVESARKYEKDENIIIAVIDGDDQLCNNDTVDILINAYSEGNDVVWTGHKWDVNGMNISKDMPFHVDPYQWPWCTSHFRTFKASLLNQISDENFKNIKGEWFERGYDQALMLPLLYLTKNRKFIKDVCYL